MTFLVFGVFNDPRSTAACRSEEPWDTSPTFHNQPEPNASRWNHFKAFFIIFRILNLLYSYIYRKNVIYFHSKGRIYFDSKAQIYFSLLKLI